MAGRKPGTPKTGGRKKGVPNKVNAEFRETVRQLLEGNSSNVGTWLEQVAMGIGMPVVVMPPEEEGGKPQKVFVPMPDGRMTCTLADVLAGRLPEGASVQWMVLPDPDKALQRLAGLAEFAAPKLNRTEHTGPNGGPVEHQVSTVERRIVRPADRNG